MRVLDTDLPGVRIFEPDRFEDERGWFMELWNEERYRELGLDVRFVQTNVSWSRKGVLRGLHYQWPNPQGKLVSVLEGAVFDVVVDIRQGSPTFAKWYGCELSRQNRRQLWVPEGFAHGFLVLSEAAAVLYECTAPYERSSDRSIAWADPEIGVAWPRAPEIVSTKDRLAPQIGALAADALPTWSGLNVPGRRKRYVDSVR